MRNKKIILTCAVIMAAASLITYLQTKNDLMVSDPSPMQTSPDLTKSQKHHSLGNGQPAPTIPHFVAGRPSLVKKAEAIYGKQEDANGSIRKPSSGKKIPSQKNPMAQSFEIKSAGVSFSNDLYACSEDECADVKPLYVTNGFRIIKGLPPAKIKAGSPSLVTYNKDTNQFGIWEKRVIIELKEDEALEKELAELKFSEIEKPQPTLYIAQYNGETREIDSILNQIKQNRNVKDVRLEVTYSKVRPN